jgi:hypothetical protein
MAERGYNRFMAPINREQPEENLQRVRPTAPAAEEVESGAPDGLPLDYCPNCSARLASRQCKMICPRCGYFLSCSDYY